MKLAEALQERADLNRRIQQLQQRLENNAMVQEGERPAEDPAELLAELDGCADEHFKAMSLIHALGWRDTYADAVPADYMAREITDDRWVEVFRQNYETQNGVHGLLLYHLRQRRLRRLGRDRLLLHPPGGAGEGLRRAAV